MRRPAITTYCRMVQQHSQPHTSAPAPATLGALRAAATCTAPSRRIRDNLLAGCARARIRSPASSASTTPCCPQVERAMLAGHDFVLLGERGQGKTRLIRTLVGLLDEWTPVIAGLRDQRAPVRAGVAVGPAAPSPSTATPRPVGWLHRSQRYGEKLATPDTSVGDLIGDVDPIKVAEGRTLGDPETVHFGLVPRTNRGIFAVNELPDLAERIQVALLNVLEERDIQVRGYQLRLPLDLLLVASANPEDYTNRGRIITPLKDRFGAEVRTHYPLRLADEIELLRQEADLAAVVPNHLIEVIARFTRLVRESPAVDGRSGVSARFAVAGAETVAASALRRAALTGEDVAVARVCDLPAVVSSLRGKVEFEVSEEGREDEVLAHLLRRAVAETFRARLGGVDLSALIERFDEGATVETGDLVPADDAAASGRQGRRAGQDADRARRGRRRDLRAWPRRRSRSRSRGSTSPGGSARTRSPAARSTAAHDPRLTPRARSPRTGCTDGAALLVRRLARRARPARARPYDVARGARPGRRPRSSTAPTRRRAARPAAPRRRPGCAASTTCCAGSADAAPRARALRPPGRHARAGARAARHGGRAGARRAVPRPVRRRPAARGRARRPARATPRRAVRELADYDWRSTAARATFERAARPARAARCSTSSSAA